MKLHIDDIVELVDGRVVRIMEIRDKSYMYPIWFVDAETGVADGCKFKDVRRKGKASKQ
ncbi:MAG: hypothetical protein ACXQTX_02410 [Candidatus Syntropharchaeia archaeon]